MTSQQTAPQPFPHQNESGNRQAKYSGKPNRTEPRPAGDSRKRTGNRGEEIAATYLEQQGVQIIARNWRKASGELDIIAADGSTLVFVEVRTRSSRAYGNGEDSVDRRKQRQVRKMAALYLGEVGSSLRCYRFDVIIVDLTGPDKSFRDIRHYQNAF
ncbi:MAG TPA: YraN family protein [Bacilli bacterium]|nr:YraN family protein [Bacilli bacterium]